MQKRSAEEECREVTFGGVQKRIAEKTVNPHTLNTPRAPPGPERIYLSSVWPGPSGKGRPRRRILKAAALDTEGSSTRRDPVEPGGPGWGPRGPKPAFGGLFDLVYIYIYVFLGFPMVFP